MLAHVVAVMVDNTANNSLSMFLKEVFTDASSLVETIQNMMQRF